MTKQENKLLNPTEEDFHVWSLEAELLSFPDIQQILRIMQELIPLYKKRGNVPQNILKSIQEIGHILGKSLIIKLLGDEKEEGIISKIKVFQLRVEKKAQDVDNLISFAFKEGLRFDKDTDSKISSIDPRINRKAENRKTHRDFF